MKTMNVAIIGTKFMGKAHSNAWLNAPRFFDMGIKPVLKVACGQNEAELKAFAERWGWEETETDWRKVMERDDVDIVDISVPTYLHRDIAVAAAKAGKHIFCEKPFALNLDEAREMYEAADAALNDALGDAPDLVLSDMAANTVGHAQTDHLRTMGLVEAAAWFAVEHLKPGGAFVAKVFAGGTDKDLLILLKQNFRTVKHAKPPASRKGSSEWYVIAQGFKGQAAPAPEA